MFLAFQNSAGNFDDLFWRLAGSKNHFRKAFAQRAVRVDLGERKLGDWSCLESAQDRVGIHCAGTKLLQ
jgi:hypothetical protein